MPENHHAKESVRYLRVGVMSTLLAILSTWLIAVLFLDERFLSDLTGRGRVAELQNQHIP